MDWLSTLEDLFEWHNFNNARCIHLASWKLFGHAKSYWQKVLRDNKQLDCLFITLWVEIKENLEENIFFHLIIRDQGKISHYTLDKLPFLLVMAHGECHINLVRPPSISHVIETEYHYCQPMIMPKFVAQTKTTLVESKPNYINFTNIIKSTWRIVMT